MPQPNLRIAQTLRGNVDCRSVAHLTRASEHGLSGECRRWGRAKSEADTRTEEGDEMDGWTDDAGRTRDGRTDGEMCPGTELGSGAPGLGTLIRWVGVEKYDAPFE